MAQKGLLQFTYTMEWNTTYLFKMRLRRIENGKKVFTMS